MKLKNDAEEILLQNLSRGDEREVVWIAKVEAGLATVLFRNQGQS